MFSSVLNSLFYHLPHFEFLDDNNVVINCLFAGALGGSTGVLLFVIITELYRYVND